MPLHLLKSVFQSFVESLSSWTSDEPEAVTPPGSEWAAPGVKIVNGGVQPQSDQQGDTKPFTASATKAPRDVVTEREQNGKTTASLSPAQVLARGKHPRKTDVLSQRQEYTERNGATLNRSTSQWNPCRDPLSKTSPGDRRPTGNDGGFSVSRHAKFDQETSYVWTPCREPRNNKRTGTVSPKEKGRCTPREERCGDKQQESPARGPCAPAVRPCREPKVRHSAPELGKEETDEQLGGVCDGDDDYDDDNDDANDDDDDQEEGVDYYEKAEDECEDETLEDECDDDHFDEDDACDDDEECNMYDFDDPECNENDYGSNECSEENENEACNEIEEDEENECGESDDDTEDDDIDEAWEEQDGSDENCEENEEIDEDGEDQCKDGGTRRECPKANARHRDVEEFEGCHEFDEEYVCSENDDDDEEMGFGEEEKEQNECFGSGENSCLDDAVDADEEEEEEDDYEDMICEDMGITKSELRKICRKYCEYGNYVSCSDSDYDGEESDAFLNEDAQYSVCFCGICPSSEEKDSEPDPQMYFGNANEAEVKKEEKGEYCENGNQYDSRKHERRMQPHADGATKTKEEEENFSNLYYDFKKESGQNKEGVKCSGENKKRKGNKQRDENVPVFCNEDLRVGQDSKKERGGRLKKRNKKASYWKEEGREGKRRRRRQLEKQGERQIEHRENEGNGDYFTSFSSKCDRDNHNTESDKSRMNQKATKLKKGTRSDSQYTEGESFPIASNRGDNFKHKSKPSP